MRSLDNAIIEESIRALLPLAWQQAGGMDGTSQPAERRKPHGLQRSLKMNDTCKARIGKELKSEIETLRALWELYKSDPEAQHPDYGNFNEHGLSFDYVAPFTFKGQRRGYFRYQISYGGPSSAFRFFAEGRGYKWSLDRVEYVFMDWFDGAKRTLSGANLDILTEIFDYFAECGLCEFEYAKSGDVSPAL